MQTISAIFLGVLLALRILLGELVTRSAFTQLEMSPGAGGLCSW